MSSYNNTVALITGTSSGIGKATARAFKAAGFLTVATAPNVGDLEDLRAEGCETVKFDVTDDAGGGRSGFAAERRGAGAG